MYKFLVFVGLQALCLQNTHSQAIDYPPTDIETDIIESGDLVTLPTNIEELTAVNQPQPSICPQCGRPVHLCICGYPLAVIITKSYSSVANQPNNPQICTQCGLSADLCTCPAKETSDVMAKNKTVCPQCGLSAELCNCGFFPLVTIKETTKGNQPDGDSGSICPNCGRPIGLCNCGFISEPIVNESSDEVSQPDMPQSCPNCGLPIEFCTCQA